jgi:mono/diheme cytochrome c family protein
VPVVVRSTGNICAASAKIGTANAPLFADNPADGGVPDAPLAANTPSIRPRDIMKNVLYVAAICVLAGPVPLAAEDTPAGTRQYWEEHCASCHGVEGKADTKAGKKIGAINFTDPQNQAKFTDEQMFTAIKAGVKNKSGKYTMKPAENASDELIKSLVAYVRSFKK